MLDPSKVLASLPDIFRKELIESYRKIAINYVEHKWGPSELDGGKFCEIVYGVLVGSTKGPFPKKPSKPKDMVAACRALEGLPSVPGRVGDRSLRVLIPRVILAFYEIRNNRGVAHVGGDVDPNFLDATAVYGMASWTLAELVRVFHNLTTQEAQEVVNALIERKHLLVWEIEEIRRVLDTKLKKGDQALLLLYTRPSWVGEKDLFNWVEYSDLNMFRKHILQRFHKSRWLEYDVEHARVHISPLGISQVEERILAPRS